MNKRRKHTHAKSASEQERVRERRKKKPNEKVNTEDKSRDMNNHFQKMEKEGKSVQAMANQRLHPVRVPSAMYSDC